MEHNTYISRTAQALKPSGIRRYFDMLSGMKDVISLTVGQPDFATPWHIREAGIESLRRGRTYYTPNRGTAELRGELSAYLKRRFGLDYNAESELLITVGGSEAIDLALRALLDPGDEVIIPVPSFVCYEPLTTLAGGVAVPVETLARDGFRLTPEALRGAITPKTKAVVLPYPSNPTGAVLSRTQLEGLAEVLRDSGAAVISDEIYAELTYGKNHVSIAALDGMRERTVIVSGFSKAYAMTGWRLGYAAAPPDITEAMLKIHQYAIMCAPTVSQHAAAQALREGDSDAAEMREEYDRRRRYVTGTLRDMGLECAEPEGAFYVFPRVGHLGLTSEQFCARLLESERVAIIPGTAFGDCAEGFVRISYAYSVEHLTTALKRISRFVTSLK